jgi:hypothetical protein
MFIAALLLRLGCGVMIEEVAFSELSFLFFASESVTVAVLALVFIGVAAKIARAASVVGLPAVAELVVGFLCKLYLFFCLGEGDEAEVELSSSL